MNPKLVTLLATGALLAIAPGRIPDGSADTHAVPDGRHGL